MSGVTPWPVLSVAALGLLLPPGIGLTDDPKAEGPVIQARSAVPRAVNVVAVENDVEDAKPIRAAVKVEVRVLQLAPAVALPAVQVAIEEKPVADKAAKEEPKAELVKKPKAAAAAINIDALAAPFVKALEGKLDLNPANPALDAQVQQWIPQFTQQSRPVLLAELNFIRQTCELAPAQRPKIKAAGEAALVEAARMMAERQVGRNNGVASEQPNGRRHIREALANALKETLNADQMAKYTEEANLRTATRKRAAISNLVARLDTAMCLTQEQREKIAESISASWQENWEQWLVLSVYGDQYFPVVPDSIFVSHLNAEQKTVWNGSQKVDFTFWGGGGEVEQNDGWWGDAPAKGMAAPRAVGVGFF